MEPIDRELARLDPFLDWDIAEILGIPCGTVKNRLQAAVKALRAQEENDGAD